MLKFPSFHIPYREDRLWGLLALAVFVVPLLFTYYMADNFETAKFSVWLACTGLAAMVLVLRRTLPKTFGYSKAVYALVGIFFLAALVSFSFSPDKNLSMFGLYPRYTSSVVFFGTWAVFLLLLVACCDRDKWRTLAKILVVDGLLVAIVGLVQSFGFGYYEGPGSLGIVRAPGLLGNPNFSSMFLVQVLPFALLFAVESKNTRSRLWYGVSSFLIMWSIITFTSRGALLALVGTVLVLGLGMLAAKLPKRAVWATVAALVLILGATAAIFSIGRPGSVEQVLKRTADQNVETRLFVWDVARQAVLERPWTGVGLGAFQIFYEGRRTANVSAEVNNFDDAHNVALQMAATGGLPLVLSFLGLLGLALYVGVRSVFKRDYTAIALVASVAGFLLAGSFTPVAIPCYVALAVVLAGLFQPIVRFREVNFSLIAKVPLATLGFAMVLWGTVITVSDAIFYQAKIAYLRGQYEKSLAWATAASRLNPFMQLYYLYEAGSRVKLGGDSGKLDSDARHLVAIHPVSVTSYDRAANLYYLEFSKTRKGDPFFKAMQNLETANEKEPYQAARYLKMAISYFDANKLNESKENAKAALALNERQLSGWILLAKIYQIQGNRPSLIFALDKAMRLFPEAKQTKYLLQIAKSDADISAVQLNLNVPEGVLE